MDHSDLTLLFQLLTITLPIIAVIIGYYSSKRLEVLKENRKQKAELFSKYIHLSNMYSFVESKQQEKELDKLYTEISEKLCLYANENVLTKLSELHVEYRNNKEFISTPEGKEIYYRLVRAMRLDIGIKVKKLDKEKIINILELE